MSCVGRARSGADARKQISAMKPDLLLLDVHLPDGRASTFFAACSAPAHGPG